MRRGKFNEKFQVVVLLLFLAMPSLQVLGFENKSDQAPDSAADDNKSVESVVEQPIPCPKVNMMKNVQPSKLMGLWYAYATTPLSIPVFTRRCSSYNVRDSPYFKTNILFTDYKHFVITYSCRIDDITQMTETKTRILTRSRTPLRKSLDEALDVLKANNIDTSSLKWLRRDGYCFEWYQLKVEVGVRKKQLVAPFNQPEDLR
ncbi:uncharacterized protein LOC115628603 [Scaptodrosophila lebanonensis]|uniref:Uncharacterized protein LOC115628603 n=1 Tax=Drosophila lebanonensis TaxID=7225 RepID=A0A6J2U0L5_DROLE|nr:uncharacterized protein LOC115628603 [Scaptodrosophila lebanonensis]